MDASSWRITIMSKKADDKKKNQGAGAKLPELVIDPDEEEHKKRDAYEMVQRAMIRSQVYAYT